MTLSYYMPIIIGLALLPIVWIIYSPIFVFYAIIFIYLLIANYVDYRLLKRYYFNKQKWDFNICCGNTDGGGINADIIKRDVPNFRLIKDVYNLPFKNKEFKNVLCSHTMEHVENPDKFYNELKRISKNVVILIPPIWDIGCMGNFREHKWQFLTLKTKHVNALPNRFPLPFWTYQKIFKQKLAG